MAYKHYKAVSTEANQTLTLLQGGVPQGRKMVVFRRRIRESGESENASLPATVSFSNGANSDQIQVAASDLTAPVVNSERSILVPGDAVQCTASRAGIVCELMGLLLDSRIADQYAWLLDSSSSSGSGMDGSSGSSSSGGGGGVTSYPATLKIGTIANPLCWDDLVDTSFGNRKHTVEFSTVGGEGAGEAGTYIIKCVYVYLEADTSYVIELRSNKDTRMHMYDASGHAITHNDDWDETGGFAGGGWPVIDGVSRKNDYNSSIAFTPEVSAFYIIGASCGTSDEAYEDASFHITENPGGPFST